MARMDALYRSLPKASNVDVQQIRGNCSDAEKQLNANIITFFLTGEGPSKVPHPFAREHGHRPRITELNVWENGAHTESEIVLEVAVTEDMCNVFGSMHGAYGIYLLDIVTVSTMVLLGRAKGFDGIGVSQFMNIQWHSAALPGDHVTVTGRSVFADKRARIARCELRNKKNEHLIATGTHSFLNAGSATKL
ncbi:hypothetical protein C8R43DRAFT_940188 [Mycena crocata]|nr:hypothetical protein C8R43DRAFT_940188 [Mycena crocata]